MNRAWKIILAAGLAVVLPVAAVFAGNVHLNGSVNFAVGSLTASGVLAGLGHDDVNVILAGSGTGTATCRNQGGNEAPGINPIQVEVSGLESIPATVFENGSTPFSVTVEDPTWPTAREAGCPNKNWSVVDFSISWTGAVLTVESVTTGEILLEQAYSCVTTPDSVVCTPL